MPETGPELDADRALALAYVPTARRKAVATLWALDVALGQVLAGGREPLISQIKLAWWRDALEKIDDARPPAEPVLQAAAEHVLPHGISGRELSALEGGWAVLLSANALSPAELRDYSAGRGTLLFQLSARILGASLPPNLEPSARGWALVDLARHSNEVDGRASIEDAAHQLRERPRWPTALRPIGMLASLARRDVERGWDAMEPHGAPGRMLTMLRHRLTGR